MRIRFTHKAVENLDAISGYLTEKNPAAAKRVRTAILESLNILKKFPEAGRPQTTEGVRKLVVRRYPYLIYYAADLSAGELFVLSVKHAAQEPEHENS